MHNPIAFVVVIVSVIMGIVYFSGEGKRRDTTTSGVLLVNGDVQISGMAAIFVRMCIIVYLYTLNYSY